MSFAPSRGARLVRRTLTVATLVALGALALAASASAKTSTNVGYITDFGAGSNDTCGPFVCPPEGIPGSSLWVNALTGTAPGGS